MSRSFTREPACSETPDTPSRENELDLLSEQEEEGKPSKRKKPGNLGKELIFGVAKNQGDVLHKLSPSLRLYSFRRR
jgi:hypothetical protein